MARGHAWFDDLVSGRAKSIADIAEREGVNGRYVARLLDLALLPPALVEDIVAGRAGGDDGGDAEPVGAAAGVGRYQRLS